MLPITLQSFIMPKVRHSSWSAATKAQPQRCPVVSERECSGAARQTGQQVACPADLQYSAGQIYLCCIKQQMVASCLTP